MSNKRWSRKTCILLIAVINIGLFVFHEKMQRSTHSLIPSKEKGYADVDREVILEEESVKPKNQTITFEDYFFKPILESYKKKANGTLTYQIERFRSGPIPSVLLFSSGEFWNKFWDSQLTHIKRGLCPLPCNILHNVSQKHKADAILFHLKELKNHQRITRELLPRDFRQPWIMLSFEAPPIANKVFKNNFTSFNGIFNRTLTYRFDADVRMPHGFIVKRGRDVEVLPKSWVIPPVMNRGNQTRKIAVAFISNCHDNSHRLNYVKMISKYIKVDVYGYCGNLKCGSSLYVDKRYDPLRDRCLKMAGNSYLFYFAFENAFCLDYLTEKVYNLLYYPIVPVVRGSANYAALFPPNSYVDASQLSAEELAKKLMYLQNNPQKHKADAILFHLKELKNHQRITRELLPRDFRQPWIMLFFEAPPIANKVFKNNFTSFNGIFNRTLTYRFDADVRMPHGFIVKRGRDVEVLPKSWVIPPVMNRGNQTRKIAVAFISNCHDNSHRLNYVKMIGKYIKVDVYGKCGKLKCGSSLYVKKKYDPLRNSCLKMAGNNYLFYFAFENAFCLDYLTEKAYNLLYYPIVPVVRGSANYAALFPPNSYVDASQLSPEELAKKLLYLKNNPQEYQKYLAWKQEYQPSTIGGERTLCHLCTQLYNPDFYEEKVIADFQDWFVKKSNCRH